MNKETMIEEMKSRGYEVIEDNHVITFKKEGYIEDLIPAIKEILSEIGYVGTWGVRALSKNPDKRAERTDAPAALEEDTTPNLTEQPIADEDPYKNVENEPIREVQPKEDSEIIRIDKGIKPVHSEESTKKDIKEPSGYTQMSLMDLFG